MYLPSYFSLSYQKADTSSTKEKKLTRKREEICKVLEERKVCGWVGEYEKQHIETVVKIEGSSEGDGI